MTTTLRIILMFFVISLSLTGQADDKTYFPIDSWRVAQPEDVGLSTDEITEWVNSHAANFEQINSILIIKDGYLVVEEYFNGTDADTVRNAWSITKSLMSTLVGMAIDDGVIPHLDVTLADALPQYFIDGQFADKADITLQDLLMMRSGIGWVEIFQTGNFLKGDTDEVLTVLSNPMVAAPGVFWNYSTGASHLISAMFEAYTGQSLEAYAQDRLFVPLGITTWDWREDITGTNFGGSEFYTTPLNLARFGYWVLQHGEWDGQQLVSPEWIALTTTTAAENTDRYGYHWWHYDLDGVTIFAAEGFGGQIIVGVPEYDLLVVITSEPAFRAPGTNDHLDWLQETILRWLAKPLR